MKIRTIIKKATDSDELREFDQEVNAALEEGWILGKRDIMPAVRLGDHDYLAPRMYAELVLLDPPAEPETIDPFLALHQVKEFCKNVPAHTCKENCPLFDWCELYAGETDPCDWHLPEVEA